MAEGAIGKVGSYATVDPSPDYLGNALNNVEDNAFRYREEAQKNADKKKLEDEEKVKELELVNQKFKPTITGNQTMDDMSLPFAYEAKQKYADLQRQYDQAKTYQEKADIKGQQGRIMQSFDTFQQVPKMLNEKRVEILDGIEKGKYNSRSIDEVTNLLKAVETGKGRVYLDEYSNPVVDLYDVDESGNITGIVKKGQSIANIISSVDPKLAFNYETYKDTALKNVKPEEYGSQTGANVVKGTKVSDSNKEQAKTYAEVIINDPDKLYEAQYLFKENDPEKLRAKLENDFITSIPTGRVQSIDTGYISEGRMARKDARDAKKEDVQRINTTFTEQTSKDDFLGTKLNPNSVYKNMKAVTKVKFDNLGGEKSKLNAGVIEGFALQKNGKIVVNGKALKTKGAKFKTADGESVSWEVATQKAATDPMLQAQLDSYSEANNYGSFSRELSGTELAIAAKNAGYDSVEELKSELRDMNREEARQDKSKPKKETKNNDPLGLF